MKEKSSKVKDIESSSMAVAPSIEDSKTGSLTEDTSSVRDEALSEEFKGKQIIDIRGIPFDETPEFIAREILKNYD